jgi:hypothetical protein
MPVKEVLVKDRVWPILDYEPHAGQQRVHDSPARHRVVPAGRRFGKSVIGGHELTVEALYTATMAEELIARGKRREFWIVGPEYSDSEKEFRVLWNDLKNLEVPLDHPGSYNNPESGDLHVSLWNGAFEVHGKSAKYPTTLVGEGLSGVILAEAAKLKEKVWTKFIRPTLADFRGWSLSTSTPEGKNWFYRNYQRGLNPDDPEWASFRMPSWKNSVVFPLGRKDPEILDMESDMSAERFNQEIGADFTDFVGRVFKDFDEEIHVASLHYDRRYPLYACCDYGWTNPFVWLLVQVDVFDNITVLAEYRAVNKDINDIADDLKSMAINGAIKTFYPDPAEPGDTAVIEKALRKRAVYDTGGELKWRLELIRQALKVQNEHARVGDPERKPRLLIDRGCTELIREMLDYRYPDTAEEQKKSNPEAPLDKDDHGPEALGRFFRGYYGGAQQSAQRARQKKAVFK